MTKCPLYTATGDRGETSLVGGERVSKCSPRLEAYGTVDEFSAFLGVALSHRECPTELKAQMLVIQNTLFDLGCYLATAPQKPHVPAPDAGSVDCGDIVSKDGKDTSCLTAVVVNGLSQAQVEEVERWTDELYAQVPQIRAFVLPGGSEVAASLHVARTVCRRAERRVLALASEEPVGEIVLRYMNRLSDYLFVASRYANAVAGVRELTWQAAQ